MKEFSDNDAKARNYLGDQRFTRISSMQELSDMLESGNFKDGSLLIHIPAIGKGFRVVVPRRLDKTLIRCKSEYLNVPDIESISSEGSSAPRIETMKPARFSKGVVISVGDINSGNAVYRIPANYSGELKQYFPKIPA